MSPNTSPKMTSSATYSVTSSAAGAAAEDVTEYVAEDVAECVRRIEAAACTARGIDARMAVLVVGRPLRRVRQDLVGLLGFLEFLFGLVVARIAVRMEFHREAPIRLLDVGFARRA